MADTINTPSSAEVRALLGTVAQFLRQAHRLGPETQLVLADFVEELGRALEQKEITATEIGRLTDCAAHLLDAVHDEEPGVLENARTRLEGAVVAVETQVPTVAGLMRRLAATLADLGI